VLHEELDLLHMQVAAARVHLLTVGKAGMDESVEHARRPRDGAAVAVNTGTRGSCVVWTPGCCERGIGC
jgi:hypothetical protein